MSLVPDYDNSSDESNNSSEDDEDSNPSLAGKPASLPSLRGRDLPLMQEKDQELSCQGNELSQVEELPHHAKELRQQVKELPQQVKELPHQLRESTHVEELPHQVKELSSHQEKEPPLLQGKGVSSINYEKLQSQQVLKLPTPGFIKNSEESNMPLTSVFTNPFIEAENAKKALLEKHVKMVNTKDNTDMINGKKICWNYRKGKCRFGHNCKYAHDSDLQKPKEQLVAENQTQQTVLFQNQKLPEPTLQELNEFKEEALSAIKKRKRPGLSQGLVPGKKVMKNYLNQKK